MSLEASRKASRKALRLWPGVVILALQLVARFVLPVFDPDLMVVGVLGGLAGGVAVALWWLFLSRAPWSERLGAVGLMAAALFVTSQLVDKSIARGAMGMLFPILAVPSVCMAFVVWAVLAQHLSGGLRWASMVATILLASGAWVLVRTGGFTTNFRNDLAWRWAKTPEERLLAQGGAERMAPPSGTTAGTTPPKETGAAAGEPVPPAPAARAPRDDRRAAASDRPSSVVTSPAVPAVAVDLPTPLSTAVGDWPGFRGRGRDGAAAGVQIRTDWATSPPVELWRRAVGPGWSSFAVQGDLLYTQEQRGEDEVVACYRASTGEPVWKHRDAARFWESNGGAGPRATPTLSNGRVYTLGGTGVVNALDAADGGVVWSRNAAADTGAKVPIWGFSGSPLVVDNLVVVAASGALVAYDVGTGDLRWLGPKGGEGYSSPHLSTIGGVTQVLLVSGTGLTSVAPSDGKVLWEHAWAGYPIVQPATTTEGDVLISVSNDSGTRRLAIAHGPEGWTNRERWTSTGLKPYFNDFVIHEGHAYGFDGSLLACINLEDGQRKWKGGRYGGGQLVLLPDQDVLLVVSEQGELALVQAAPDRFFELARFPAIEGKTWNHPVLAGDVLLVRNDQEMAAFRLARADR